MILVDTSVWIDHINQVPTPQAQLLAVLLGTEKVVLGDLIVLELLQGVRSPREARLLERDLMRQTIVSLFEPRLAPVAAAHYRRLRLLGFTIRKTVDLIIGTWCIDNGCELLHRDRDFLPMERHLGLRARAPISH